MVEAAYYQDLLRPQFQGRRVIIFAQPLAGATQLVKTIRLLGAQRCLIIATGEGTGPLPSTEDAKWLVLDGQTADIIEEFRRMERILQHPPEEVLAAGETYDPDRQAFVITPAVALAPHQPHVAGRPIWGRRSAASVALEDKVTVDAFWDDVGVRRAQSAVVPIELDDLRRAGRRLDRGLGTVWAGDARDGVHGGATRIRWVRSEEDMRDALEFFRARCDGVRVMPFLEGIPCSIHGIVFDDLVVAVRPVEMVTLRQRDTSRLRYCGAATFWDPLDADREYMRMTARRVGAALRQGIGFRGAFTIDGVMAAEGFLPTELNPRYGAGLDVIGQAESDLPLSLLMLAVVANEPLDYRPGDLEELLVNAADNTRAGGAWTLIEAKQETTREIPLAGAEGAYRLAGIGVEGSAALILGPGATGGFIRFRPDPRFIPAGHSMAGRAVAAFALADRELSTNIGPLEAAREVRQ